MATSKRIEYGVYKGYLMSDPAVPDDEIETGYQGACDRLAAMNNPEAVCYWNPYRDKVRRGELDDYPTWGWVEENNPGYYEFLYGRISQEARAFGEERAQRLKHRVRDEVSAPVSDELFSPETWERIEREDIDILCLEIFEEGYKRRAQRDHPDKPGGSGEAQNRLNFAREIFRGLIDYLRSDEAPARSSGPKQIAG